MSDDDEFAYDSRNKSEQNNNSKMGRKKKNPQQSLQSQLSGLPPTPSEDKVKSGVRFSKQRAQKNASRSAPQTQRNSKTAQNASRSRKPSRNDSNDERCLESLDDPHNSPSFMAKVTHNNNINNNHNNNNHHNQKSDKPAILAASQRATTQATMQEVCAMKIKESELTQTLITQQIEREKLQIEREKLQVKREKLQVEQEKRRSEEDTARHTLELQILQKQLVSLECEYIM